MTHLIHHQVGLKDAKRVRQGWAEACKRMHADKKDKLLLNDKIMNQFEQNEWKW